MTGSDFHSFAILKDTDGKPYLYPQAQENIYISLSHKTHFLWAGVSRKSFGIDIEKKDPRLLKLIPKFINIKDQKFLGPNPDLEKLARIWTFKEAAVKCIGIDFMDIASNLSLENSENGESLLIYYNKIKDIRIFLKGYSIESGNYLFSIVTRE